MPYGMSYHWNIFLRGAQLPGLLAQLKTLVPLLDDRGDDALVKSLLNADAFALNTVKQEHTAQDPPARHRFH